MNRLTERINGEAYVKRYGGLTSICYGCDRVGTCKKKKCGFYHAIDKLASYEDTGLEPEEVKTNEEMFKAYRLVTKTDFGVGTLADLIVKDRFIKILEKLYEYEELEEQAKEELKGKEV